MPCRRHARQLAARTADRSPPVRAAVAGPGRPRDVENLTRRLALPIPAWADPTGAALDALGFPRVFGLVRQSGLVVLDPSGTVRHAQRGSQPARALDYEAALAVLHTLAAAAPEGGAAR